ncbi:hypothetical protein GCM10007079_30630 [Nocardiopsis terrae]|nr:hypothetical protein GCM10007079_30630 [Nocardiopsis terrae]
MGVVYAGIAPNGGAVAIKTVHAELAANPEFRARFAREVDLLRRVGGTCVVPVLDADVRALRPWLVTPLIQGPTLADHVRWEGPLDPSTVNGLALGVAEALSRIHEHGVAHRDLKPANVILSSDGPRVLDFGIARAVDETALTRTGSLVGTAGWISPQHYRGLPPTYTDDVFAWGCLVAFAATGRPPFGTGAPDAVAFRVLREEPDLAGFDGPLADVVRRALSKDADGRPTAAELLTTVAGLQMGCDTDVLEQPTEILTRVIGNQWPLISDAPTRLYEAVPPSGTTARGRARSGRPLALAAGAIALLVLVVSTAWWLGTERRAALDGDPTGPEGQSGTQVEEDMPESEVGNPEYIVAQARIGPGAEPLDISRIRPEGGFVIGLHPYDPEGDPDNIDPISGEPGVDLYEFDPLWARITDDAEVLCAWVFCQDTAGGLDPHGFGTTPAKPEDIMSHFEEQLSRDDADPRNIWLVAEVTYTVNVNGVGRITRIVEMFTP